MLLSFHRLSAQPIPEDLLSFLKGKDPLVDQVLREREKFRLQFLVSGIRRGADDKVRFEEYSFTDGSYFYPASMVKLPAALISLEILDSLQIPLNSFIRMNDDAGCGNTSFRKLTRNGNLSFTDVTEELIAISNNPYFSLLFHFAGPAALNGRMQQKNLRQTRIYSAYTSCPKRADVKTSSYQILDTAGREILSVPVRIFPYAAFRDNWPAEARKRISRNRAGSQPLDFNDHHEYSLADIHGTMQRLIFPETFPGIQRFHLKPSSRNFLLRCLGLYPREMRNSAYHQPALYPDHYYKYSIIGEETSPHTSRNCRIFSKIGLSYGFVTETAYVVDFDSGKDFLFSVSMYTEGDGTEASGNYGYEKTARPFIARLSNLILEFLHTQLPDERCPDACLKSLKALFEK